MRLSKEEKLDKQLVEQTKVNLIVSVNQEILNTLKQENKELLTYLLFELKDLIETSSVANKNELFKLLKSKYHDWVNCLIEYTITKTHNAIHIGSVLKFLTQIIERIETTK